MQVDTNVSESDVGNAKVGPEGLLHRRGVSRPDVLGHGRAGARGADHGAERRDLRRRGERRQPGPRAPARHDGEHPHRHRRARRRRCACPLQALRFSPRERRAAGPEGAERCRSPPRTTGRAAVTRRTPTPRVWVLATAIVPSAVAVVIGPRRDGNFAEIVAAAISSPATAWSSTRSRTSRAERARPDARQGAAARPHCRGF